jgi:hypothetical protein
MLGDEANPFTKAKDSILEQQASRQVPAPDAESFPLTRPLL